MTTEHEASRTLVKSPPELWAECSAAGSLARHLGEFGEITITRLEPETTVAWEGEHASGTVRIEPSGWGTRVTLTAQTRAKVVEARVDPPLQIPQAAPAEEVSTPVTTPGGPEEEDHAKVEETLVDPNSAPGPESGAFRIRWRRMSERMRGLFRTPDADHAPAAEPVDEPDVEPEPLSLTDPEPAPPALSVPDPEPAPPADTTEDGPELDAEEILTAALDSLGQAHHRPFSRA